MRLNNNALSLSLFVVLAIAFGTFTMSCDGKHDVADYDSNSSTDTTDIPNMQEDADAKDCCEPSRSIAPETVSLHPEPVEGDSEMKLLWWKSAYCPEHFPRFDQRTNQDFAATKVSINGDDREALAVVLNSPNGGALGPAARAVAVLDTDSGEALRCIEYPQYASHVGDVLHVVGHEARYLTSYKTEGGEAAEISDIPPLRGSASISFDDETPIFHSEEALPSHEGQVMPRSVVTGTGQWITNTNATRLISVDALTGEELWRADTADFNSSPDELKLLDLFTPARDAVFVRGLLPLGSSQGPPLGGTTQPEEALFEIDETGRPTKRFEGGEHTGGPMFMGEFIVLSSGGSTLVLRDWEEEPVYRLQGCISPVSLSQTGIACINRYSNGTASLQTLALADGARKTIELPTSASGTTEYNHRIVAGAKGHVITAATVIREIEGGIEIRKRIGIVDVEMEQERDFIELERPEINAGTYSHTLPLLTPSGKLIVGIWGVVYVIQTDIPGLAPGPYPRGALLGGNENRGYVEVVEDRSP